MNDEDLKNIISKYQQKAFELFNANIVLETQVEHLNKTINLLQKEIEKLTAKPKKIIKDDFQ